VYRGLQCVGDPSKTVCELALAGTSPSAAVKILKLIHSIYLLVDRQCDKRERGGERESRNNSAAN